VGCGFVSNKVIVFSQESSRTIAASFRSQVDFGSGALSTTSRARTPFSHFRQLLFRRRRRAFFLCLRTSARTCTRSHSACSKLLFYDVGVIIPEPLGLAFSGSAARGFIVRFFIFPSDKRDGPPSSLIFFFSSFQAPTDAFKNFLSRGSELCFVSIPLSFFVNFIVRASRNWRRLAQFPLSSFYSFPLGLWLNSRLSLRTSFSPPRRVRMPVHLLFFFAATFPTQFSMAISMERRPPSRYTRNESGFPQSGFVGIFSEERLDPSVVDAPL